ncbi:MAG: hypothetical protein IKS41_03145 [Alphaproteobacteria bacterium]|nr:hypothetical protein [Alphaproteobacteria bacterium]
MACNRYSTRVITQEQLDERYQRISDYQFNSNTASFYRPLATYPGETLQERVMCRYIGGSRYQQIAFQGKKNLSDFEVKKHKEESKEKKEDIDGQMGLANRHDKNLVWIKRMKKIGIIAGWATLLSLGCGMATTSFADKKTRKNPLTMTFGTVCALSLITCGVSSLEVKRLKNSNRRIENSLDAWYILKPEERERVKNRDLYTIHMGLSGFLETFQYS